MQEKIAQLESIARQLEPGPEQRERVNAKVLAYAGSFLNGIYDIKAYEETPDKGIGIYDSPISDEPAVIEDVLENLKVNVDHQGLNPASGGHLGYIPGGGIYYAALGDYLADVMNRYSGVFYASPGAVRMENMLLQWMYDLISYPADSGGNLASGGSIANLIGIVTARDASNIRSKEFEKICIYMTSQVHHCIDKAIRIAGLKDCHKRIIPLDDRFRMDPDALEDQIKKDTQAGLIPLMVIASAGTTDTGAIDPLDLIANICQTYDIWYHIDGAYGAFFMLCEEGRKKLTGIQQSDSIVMDPHKGLFLPYGTGAILVKNKHDLIQSHYYQANYLQDAIEEAAEVSPADVSPELTKHFRGLRLWLPLKLYGLRPFKACIEEKLALAKYFYRELEKIEGFERGPEPDLSVVTYRYLPKSGNADDFNKKLVEAIRSDGRVFISSTMIDQKFTLRLAVLSFRTHKDTIDLALSVLKEKVALLSNT